MLFISGCSSKRDNDLSGFSSKQYSNTQGEHQNFQIVFPISEKWKTNYNAKVYEIEPFVLNIDFPNGWSIKEVDQSDAGVKPYHYLNHTLFSLVDVFDENSNCIGTIGYNIYASNSETDENPENIYSYIGIGNNYQFDVRNVYKVVQKNEKGDTAITDVLYSEAFFEGVDSSILKSIRKVDSDDSEYLLLNHEGFGVYYNKGILSYNRERLVYIAMEIDKTAITTEQLDVMAKSIVLE